MLPRYRYRLMLILPAGLSLLAGLWAGLSRLGWDMPLPSWSLPSYHGPFMVIGFVTTLIGLEKAVALKSAWAYVAPLLSGLGALALLADQPFELARSLMTAGSLLLLFTVAALYSRHPSTFLATMGAAAVLLTGGHLLWHKGQPLYEGHVLPWWVGFLVITVAAERLELSQVLGFRPWKRTAFWAACGTFFLGTGVSLVERNLGTRLSGAGLIGIALWLLRYDLVWKTVLRPGLPRYMALSLIAGYGWLLSGGVLWLYAPSLVPGPWYDAMLHAIFLGFIFSMILGHAPIILPSILGIPFPFERSLYAPLLLLHVSLLLRIGGGLSGWIQGQRWGGLLNVAAALFFVANSFRIAWWRRIPSDTEMPY